MSSCQGLWDCGGKDLFLAGIGSLAGALGAWWIADRAKRKDDAIKTMRAINVATSLGKAIFDEYMNAKKQRIAKLKSNYDAELAKFLSLQALFNSGHLEGKHTFVTDLGVINVPFIPIAALEREVYERLGVSGRLLACMNAVINWSNSFASMVALRQQVVDEFKVKGGIDTPSYFGQPKGTIADSRYKDTMQCISEYCDYVIYFAYHFTKESEKYGHRHYRKNKGLLRSSGLRVSTTDFEDAFKQGLMPKEERFHGWEKGLIEIQPELRGWAWLIDYYRKARDECRFPMS